MLPAKLAKPLLIWALIGLLFPCAAGAGRILDRDHEIFVEPGDTLIGLFGNDWNRVMERNTKVVFLDPRGRQLPDKLVPGMRLIIPAGTSVSDLTLLRLYRYQGIKEKTLATLAHAQKILAGPPLQPSEPLRRAKEKLLLAQAAATGTAYSYANYAECKRLTAEALVFYQAAVALEKQSRRSGTEDLAADAAGRSPLPFIVVGVTGAHLLALLVYLTGRKRKVERLRMKSWLSERERWAASFEEFRKENPLPQ